MIVIVCVDEYSLANTRRRIFYRSADIAQSSSENPTKKRNFSQPPNHLTGGGGRKLAAAGLVVLVRAISAALTRTGAERFGHDALDGAGAAAAFGAAAETAV
jgi:hypothetical protein